MQFSKFQSFEKFTEELFSSAHIINYFYNFKFAYLDLVWRAIIIYHYAHQPFYSQPRQSLGSLTMMLTNLLCQIFFSLLTSAFVLNDLLSIDSCLLSIDFSLNSMGVFLLCSSLLVSCCLGCFFGISAIFFMMITLFWVLLLVPQNNVSGPGL